MEEKAKCSLLIEAKYSSLFAVDDRGSITQLAREEGLLATGKPKIDTDRISYQN